MTCMFCHFAAKQCCCSTAGVIGLWELLSRFSEVLGGDSAPGLAELAAGLAAPEGLAAATVTQVCARSGGAGSWGWGFWAPPLVGVFRRLLGKDPKP
jgi:hypothetical protein